MMNCNEITQRAEELKMTMESCSILSASQMQELIDLILALDKCKCLCADAQAATKIHSFQFDSLTYNIDNIDLVTDEFLNLNGLQHLEESLLAGKNIQYDKLGRIGFVIENLAMNPYTILDILNNDITTVTFDYVYDNNISYFVSKEFVTPSIIYFKFQKN